MTVSFSLLQNTQSFSMHYITGLKIATDMVANLRLGFALSDTK